MNPKLINHEFPLREDICYLNHAAVSPWPRRTVDAVTAFAQENLVQGALHYGEWLKVETHLRNQLRELINAPSAEDIALLKNTSEGLSFVANGIRWDRGDNIVSSDEEFPSNRIVWQALAPYGVSLKQVALHESDLSPEDALITACDDRTRLLAISSVQYASGLRLDLAKLGRFCTENGILFCIDAIQSLGAVRFDVQACNAHFVVADAHKWMLGPEGIALFFVKPSVRDELQLCEYGWHMVEDQWCYERTDWRPAPNARRFECGSPNMLGVHAFSASLSLILEVGVEEIERIILNNASYVADYIYNSRLLLLKNSRVQQQYAGIVSFTHKNTSAERCFANLAQSGVVCAVRGGAIRFSPHFYTPREKIETALGIACESS